MTKPNPDPILLTSEQLTSVSQNMARLKASAAQSRAEIWRCAKILFPDRTYDETSSTVWDGDVAKFARIGLVHGRQQGQQEKGAVRTDSNDETARRKEAIERTLAGESIVTPTSLREQYESEQSKLSATLDAIEFLAGEIEREKTALAIQYSKEMKPKHSALMDTVCKKILETHAAWRELYDLKRHLIDSGVGLRGLCLNLPDFLGTPVDPYSDMADFLRAAKNEGFISKLPAELVLR